MGLLPCTLTYVFQLFGFYDIPVRSRRFPSLFESWYTYRPQTFFKQTNFLAHVGIQTHDLRTGRQGHYWKSTSALQYPTLAGPLTTASFKASTNCSSGNCKRSLALSFQVDQTRELRLESKGRRATGPVGSRRCQAVVFSLC